ncbi:MAG: hypothetical protein AUF65_01510 [Chloroflexi bacterium 13_1_20CM_50_12]|nr:MAG: hypothetical protein AUF65_01510 [Chloroflexi bacterium 13_1_20CM_50_12]
MTKLANATIPVEEARVQKWSLSISVLTLNERQITQTLYKQLIEEAVVNERTGELKGPVWGWVNLHNDCWYRNNQHFHAIWEDNGELKRAFVRLPWTEKSPAYRNHRTWEESHGQKPYYDLLVEAYGKARDKNERLLLDISKTLDKLIDNWEQSYKTIQEAGQLFVSVSGVWK